MPPIFSKNVTSLTGLKITTSKVVDHATDRSVLQALEYYENFNEELSFVKAVVQGLIDVKGDDTQTIAQVKLKFGL